MKKNPLLGALPLIAKMLGRKLGVEVVIGARREACTDGRTIHLPPLPAESEALAVLANGYIDHEAAHVRYTDFTIRKPPGLAGLLVNVLEDVRIEQVLGAAYPGSRANLAALVAYLEADNPALPPPEAPVALQVLAALQYLLRARLLDQAALADGAAVLEARLDALLPAGAVVKLLALAFEVRRAASTADVLVLAARIVAMLREEAQPPAPPSSTDSAAGQAPPANDPVGGRPPAAGDPSGGQPSFGDPSGAGQSGATAGASGGAGSADAQQAALAALLAAAGAGDAAGALDLGVRAAEQLTALAGADPAAVVLAEDDDPPPNEEPAAAVARARAATAPLRRRLGGLVQARREEDAWRARRGRRLDPASLYRPSAGQPVRFVRRDARAAPDTAVGLLLDRSGSMRQTIDLASRAVLATALALEEIASVVCWAAAFPGVRNDRIVPLVGFAERARRVAGRFDLPAAGGTPLANALWRAGYELGRRPEPRRLLVVATDGEPDDVDAARRIVARCRAGGIEVLGLGIGLALDRVRTVFGHRDAAAIATIEALAPALFGLLEQRL